MNELESREPFLSVAGDDVSQELLPRLTEKISGRSDGGGLSQQLEDERPPWQGFRERGEEEADAAMLAHLAARSSVDPSLYRIECSPGRKGRLVGRVRRALWVLLRPSFQWFCFRQNAVNRLMLHLLGRERQRRQVLQGELDGLRERLSSLEEVRRES